MIRLASVTGILVVLFPLLTRAAETKLDIRNGIPASAYMAVYGEHNPERDYQRTYLKQVWRAIQEEKLPERVLGLAIELLPASSKEAATSASDELQNIFEPVNWSAVGKIRESAYGQVMDSPQTHHIFIMRLSSKDDAATLESAIKKMGEMIERRADGKVVAKHETADDVELHTLSAPKLKDFPFQPSFARLDDIILISSSEKVARESLKSLSSGGPSKFDDPRLKTALSKLPKPDDSLVFYDGHQQFRQLHDIGRFIREKASKNEKALRMADVFERILDELSILDYQVTVENTNSYKNIKTESRQLVSDSQDKMLYKVLASGKPFDDWQRWIPADAQAYSLASGVNLHALYDWLIPFIEKEFPEAKPKLEKLEQKQDQWGIHIDRDILQAFSGEFVSVKLPASSQSTMGGHDKVVALRCQKPDRIRELIRGGFSRLEKSPFAQTQQLKLAPCKELDGFDELSTNMLVAFGVRPVIGFHEDWMIVATNSAAAKKVLDTLAGKAPSIEGSEQFKRFGLTIEEPVYAMSYSDITASTRQVAQFIRQAGLMAPAISASTGVKDERKLKLLQEAAGLLPSIANVIEKIDYLQACLSVTQKGDNDESYTKRSVTLVRPPQEK